MKKLFVLVILAATFAGCTKQYKEYYEGDTHFVRTFTILPQHWNLNGDIDGFGSYYSYGFDEVAITNGVFDGGTVQVFFMPTNDIQIPLPYTDYKGGPDPGSPTGEYLWEENYSFDYSPGEIYFYFYRSDFLTSNPPPAVTFRMVVTW